MTGQLWSVAAEGGYLYSDQLSETLRLVMQPQCKFRQLCDAHDGSDKGLSAGDQYRWNVVSNLGTQGRRLDERAPMPETGFTLTQKSLTIYEAGNSVPYTAKLDAMSKQELVRIIDTVLRDDCQKFFDIEAFLQFKRTLLRVSPTSGTSTTAVDLGTAGAAATANNVELRTGHTKAVVDLMKERNIPPYPNTGGDYLFIAHPTTLRTYKNDLESVKQYTETGLGHIFDGEIGRYEGVRHIEQNFIPKGGANDSTTFDPFSGTADAWNNAKSSWGFYMGGDTVTEATVIPEEIRAKIPGDYGRSKGVAWYTLTGFGLVHDDASNARVLMWDSTV
jgi:N4-gp56 family major capsid protein